ncbi:hypothetical protein ABMA32_03485 [Mesorhizobium sp. VNQ89]|uniref:hypothetical protein n=1 Tax=Mesorhizobium quangtriensis TaxID=3157709 RepID=UPI0032B7E65F
MRAASSSINDLGRVGPPFLHWSPEGAENVEKDIKTRFDESLVVRRINGSAARDLEELGHELGKALGRPIAGNQAALDDVMSDVHWHAGKRSPAATVYVIKNPASLLRSLPSGMALWGTKAESWARAWARSVNEGQSWDHDPVPLHFIHCADKMPLSLRSLPKMNCFEIGKQ